MNYGQFCIVFGQFVAMNPKCVMSFDGQKFVLSTQGITLAGNEGPMVLCSVCDLLWMLAIKFPAIAGNYLLGDLPCEKKWADPSSPEFNLISVDGELLHYTDPLFHTFLQFRRES